MRYVCPICGYVYDEARNPPWDALPEDWKCPLCAAARADFRPEGGEAPGPVPAAPAPADARPLSAIELSALCSGLARGCEKQYMPQQAAAFTHLADWLKSRAEQAADPSFEAILETIDLDLGEGFPAAKAVSGEHGDRGALRSLAWSEKVTLILRSLLTRFAREGEAMLENTGVYVCAICGFVFVGDAPPEACPVCKAPGRKFERIGG